MGIKDKVLQRAKKYIDEKNYNFEIINESKLVRKVEEETQPLREIPNLEVGDKVKLLDYDDYGIVYKSIDKFNNVAVLYKKEFIDVNIKRLELSLKAKELYPEGYDLNSLFVSFEDRKLEKDIARGSKKALRNIQKEIKNNR